MNLHFDYININNLLSTSMDFSRLNTYNVLTAVFVRQKSKKEKKSTVICQRTAADQFIQNVLKKDRYKIAYQKTSSSRLFQMLSYRISVVFVILA